MTVRELLRGPSALTFDEFKRKFVRTRTPFVVKNALRLKDSETRLWKWSLAELLERTKDVSDSVKYQVLKPKPPGVNYVSQWKSKKVEATLAEILQDAQSGNVPMQTRLDPSLFWQEDEELPAFMYNSRMRVLFDNSFVWLTTPGLRTSLHSDPDDGLLLHLHGKKRLMLISPKTSDRDKGMLKHLMTYRTKCGSISSLYHEDNTDDTVVLGVEKYFVDLCPGDLVYIPKRWLHDVESLDVTVSIAVRFKI